MKSLPAAATVLTASLSAAEPVASDVCVYTYAQAPSHHVHTDAAVPPVTLIATHTMRILQQVTYAERRLLQEILSPPVRFYGSELSKLRDELYSCSFLQLINVMENASDLQYGMAIKEESITLMRDIMELSRMLSQTPKAKECLNKLITLYDICL